MNMNISLNPQYAIRNEPNCSYIVNKSTTIDKRVKKGYSIEQIPPFIGLILSRFDGKNYDQTIVGISEELNLSEQSVRFFTDNLIENASVKEIKWQNKLFFFPMYLLIEGNYKADVRFDDNFNPFAEFQTHRPSVPFNVNLMITTKCKTDCIYCYSDRNKSDDLSLDKILQTIDNAYKLGVINFTITGGDIFANNDWRTIISKLVEYGYKPFISTKIPLKEEDIKYLASVGITEIQFSLDSLRVEELFNIVRMNASYKKNVEKMLSFCERYKLKLNIRSVLTKFNSSIDSMNELLLELQKHKNIGSWILTPAFYSAYKDDYKNYCAEEWQLDGLLSFFRNQKAEFHIYYNNVKSKIERKTECYQSEDEFIKKNKTCNANTYSLSIISNGKVSICEMLYDNPNFLIGDINKNELGDIWNSKKALELYKGIGIKNDNEENNIEPNPCKKCNSFDKCKGGSSKKICYVDIVNVYGKEKYNFPDPRCPKAPIADKSLMI